MKKRDLIAGIVSVLMLCVHSGCTVGPPDPPSGPDGTEALVSYSPVAVDIMPLTGFGGVAGDEAASQLKVYVSLLDAFDSQIKSPGKFRFELYEHHQRSPKPKGDRLAKWPDMDLTDAATNHSYWQDYLRGYRFVLDFEPQRDRSYVLQVTCLSQGQRRLTDEMMLKYGQ